MKGRINSLESFGAADGPGVRYVVFLQGCPMRCAYCHNPETWAMDGGEEMETEAVLARALRYKGYWGTTGGITVSGGEPLAQLPFVTELFSLAKDAGVNTALDTSGCLYTEEEPWFSLFARLVSVTDTFLLDIKHMDGEAHRRLTGRDNANILAMARYLSGHGKDMWIRRVLVPGFTDQEEELRRLAAFIHGLSSVKKVEVLPYHTLGVFKWEKAGLAYPLAGVRTPSTEEIKKAEEILGL